MRHHLTVDPLEWEIAAYYFKTHPTSKKFRRKDEYWAGHAYHYFLSTLDKETLDIDERDIKKALDQTQAFLKQVNHNVSTKYERWRAGELRVHSFEYIEACGAYVLYASAVHKCLGQGGEARVRLLESKDGNVLAKRSTRLDSYELTLSSAKSEMALSSALDIKYQTYITSKEEPILWVAPPSNSPLLRQYKSRTMMPLYAMSLADFIQENIKKATTEQLIDIAELILLQMVRLEKLGYLHKDIKPNNIMIELSNKEPSLNNISDWKLALIDFSHSCKIFKKELKVEAPQWGTTRFRAPEYHEKIQHKNSDRFSLGIMLFDLFKTASPNLSEQLYRKLCFRNPSDREAPEQIHVFFWNRCALLDCENGFYKY